MHSIPSFPCVIINIIYNVPVLVLKMSSKQRLVLNAKSDIWHDKPGKNNKWSSYLNSHMRNSLYIKKINIFYHYINTLQHFTEIFSHHSQHVMWCNMCVCVCVYVSMHVYVHVTACLLACVCMRQWQMQQSTPIQIPRASCSMGLLTVWWLQLRHLKAHCVGQGAAQHVQMRQQRYHLV